jgi:ATP-binding cassette subfamily B protein
MVDALVRGKGVRKGREAARLLASLISRADSAIPERYWSARPGESGELLIRGAVLLRVRGRVPGGVRDPGLSAELTAALEEKPAHPGLALWKMLRADGLLAPAALTFAMALAAGTVLCEGLLFRGLLDLGQALTINGQRLWALGAAIALVAGMLLLEWPVAAGILQLCRKLECRFRLEFLRKIPRLTDRYFQSRLISDMAERSHSVHQLRRVPEYGAQFLRSSFEMAATVAGIAWLYPDGALAALVAGASALAIPLLIQPFLGGRDLRVRNRLGALSVSYLDALMGSSALKAHGAEGPMRREHGTLLKEWARAGLDLQKAVARADTLQFAVCLAFSAWLLIHCLMHTGELGGALLLAYWALNLPVVGQDAAAAAWQYPRMRNIVLRLLEPLGAPEEHAPAEGAGRHQYAAAPGVSIGMEGIAVRAAGHTILEDVSLEIPASGHIGIVGSSGAGKSSLVGLLLGWHRPAAGTLRVDGEILDAEGLERLRRQTAWIDPTVQLWNESLIGNLRYGLSGDASADIAAVLDSADLGAVVQKLPDGMQCSLGEGGTLVSGGEGQRVRIGRGMLRRDARLVILDEPACGLDRESRRTVLERCREHWRAATLLCITHDVADTLRFPRVLVIENGHVVEDGSPVRLAADPDSRYRALLRAETRTREAWSTAGWRRLAVRDGYVAEESEFAAEKEEDEVLRAR